ncbi:MAG: o-succinylbenzoate synthase [Acidobacteriota bacterium]
MKIERIELREIHLQLKEYFETSFGRESRRRILLVRLYGDGQTGYGECVAGGEGPFYSSETIDTCRLMIESYIGPMVLGRSFERALDIFPALAKVRGHRMAKAGIEMAAWDLEARLCRMPLYRLLGGTRNRIEVGVSIGIQETVPVLLEKISGYLKDGYRRIKLKIKPGWDEHVLRRVRAEFPDVPLMADANSAYTLADTALFESLDDLDLMMFEQPLDYEDIIDHAQLQSRLATPICLDESIHTPDHARQALDLGSCRMINIKPGRLGGHSQSRIVHDLCQERGYPVWHGGMLESGIGRAHNIALATLPNFRLPGDISASRRYWTADIIEPEVEMDSAGCVVALDEPGIGYRPNEKRIEELVVRRDVIK